VGWRGRDSKKGDVRKRMGKRKKGKKINRWLQGLFLRLKNVFKESSGWGGEAQYLVRALQSIKSSKKAQSAAERSRAKDSTGICVSDILKGRLCKEHRVRGGRGPRAGKSKRVTKRR